jgi:WhiB family redox-sensing transcriptional regulator
MLDTSEAACLDEDPEIFFSDDDNIYDSKKTRYAKLICRGCPIKDLCFEEAVAEGHQGIWGGLTETERKRKVSSLKRSRSRGPGTLAHQMAKVVNTQRSALAADLNIPLYRKGLEEQGHDFPADFREVVEARINNPEMSLAELGVMLGISKDSVAGKLRRLKKAVVAGKILNWEQGRG